MAVLQRRGSLVPAVDPESMIIDWGKAINSGINAMNATSALMSRRQDLEIRKKALGMQAEAQKIQLDNLDLQKQRMKQNARLADIDTRKKEAEINKMNSDIKRRDDAMKWQADPTNAFSLNYTREQLDEWYQRQLATGNQYIIDFADGRVSDWNASDFNKNKAQLELEKERAALQETQRIETLQGRVAEAGLIAGAETRAREEIEAELAPRAAITPAAASSQLQVIRRDLADLAVQGAERSAAFTGLLRDQAEKELQARGINISDVSPVAIAQLQELGRQQTQAEIEAARFTGRALTGEGFWNLEGLSGRERRRIQALSEISSGIQASKDQLLRSITDTQAGVAPAAAVAEGSTATNPQTGERIVYRNGRWEPL